MFQQFQDKNSDGIQRAAWGISSDTRDYISDGWLESMHHQTTKKRETTVPLVRQVPTMGQFVLMPAMPTPVPAPSELVGKATASTFSELRRRRSCGTATNSLLLERSSKKC